MSRVEEYLQKLRTSDGLRNAILCGVTVERRNRVAEFFLVTDKAYSAKDEAFARSLSQEFLPSGFFARVKIVKRVPDRTIVRKKIFEFIHAKYPAAAAFLKEENIEVETLQSGAHFYVDIASGEQRFFTSGEILDDVSAYLQSGFCGTFYGNVRIVDKEERDDTLLDELPETEEEEEDMEIRTFEIVDYQKIDGADVTPKRAVYLSDVTKTQGSVALCGNLTSFEERTYVRHNEKTNEDEERIRFALTISDGTGYLRTSYFPKKATLDKVRELKVGDGVVLIGSNEEFKGSWTFKTARINCGKMPQDFVPVARKGKPVPKSYHTVFPEPYVDYTQAGIFDITQKPPALTNNTFVVFDLETTGLNNQPAMGKMDKIIEIGAVKIVGGEMVEKFSTFVACDDRLSKEIIELTGIHDEDLVGAPKIESVIADFFKFTDGAFLVGHNVMFDYRFTQYYGEQNRYMFDNRLYDTMTLAQELLRGEIPNYKLNTIADYYGFTFNHHRAFDDACVTAKIFIELVKKRGELPK